MTLIERYIFRRAFTASAGSLVSLVLIVWIVQALSRIDIVKTSASAAGNIFWIALMLLPDLAAGVVPFAILIGSVQALNALNADSERSAMAAAGASNAMITRPILLLGFLGGLFMLFVAHGIGPMASSAFQNGIRSINADTITLFLQPGRFERVRNDLVISVGETQGSTVKSLFIHDTRDPNLDLTYFAREASIVETQDGQQVLMLFDGQLHRKNRANSAVSIIEFQTYAFDLSDLKPSGGRDWIRSSEMSTWALLQPNLDNSDFQRNPGRYDEELTDRFSSWLFCIAFALWAVAVAGQPQTNRKATNLAMTLGIAGAVVLKALGFLALSLVNDNRLFVLVVFALPLSAALFDAILIVRGIDPSQLRIFQVIGDLPIRFAKLLERLQGRRLKTATGGSGK
ncbi:lipopolysaccharide export system permease protein [Fulvimarina manganoxydans]|uniref:Lipopolysaccharide export system permease protein n=1 Tax=Fulvimarina manganoxydans TaxID=937218 RepID=A0A1W1ZR42_9HYPH|nr:LptF/LptG family permease [Fulvimarina manganoxydans]SMC51010.1 lipopolysaccharide export system permease protein [Fulvimarina manganoxydans]